MTGIVKYCQALSNIIKYCQVLSNIIKYYQLLSNILIYIVWLLGCSADAAVRAWLLAVALHQDDLPSPTCLLPPHTHPHPTQNNRVKVPSGGIFLFFLLQDHNRLLSGAGRGASLTSTGSSGSQQSAGLNTLSLH